jgi:hypothetical protein
MLSKPRGGTFVELYKRFDVIEQAVEAPSGEPVFRGGFDCHDNNVLGWKGRNGSHFAPMFRERKALPSEPWNQLILDTIGHLWVIWLLRVRPCRIGLSRAEPRRSRAGIPGLGPSGFDPSRK